MSQPSDEAKKLEPIEGVSPPHGGAPQFVTAKDILERSDILVQLELSEIEPRLRSTGHDKDTLMGLALPPSHCTVVERFWVRHLVNGEPGRRANCTSILGPLGTHWTGSPRGGTSTSIYASASRWPSDETKLFDSGYDAA